MDKLKVLNIFAIAFLASLLIQYWFFPKTNTTTVPTDIFLSIEKDSIIVPNIPKITLHNTTTGAITVNPCNEIFVTIDSIPLNGIQAIAPTFCNVISIPGNSIALLPFDSMYRVFSAQPGKYSITFKSSL